MADLFIAGWGMRAANVDAATIPVNFSNEGGVSYVVRAEPEAGAMLERFLAARRSRSPKRAERCVHAESAGLINGRRGDSAAPLEHLPAWPGGAGGA